MNSAIYQEAFEAAKGELKSVQGRFEDLRAEKERLELLIAGLLPFVSQQMEDSTSEEPMGESGGVMLSATSTPSLNEACYEALRTAGVPLSPTELFKRLEQCGYQVIGRIPVNNVRITMFRDQKRFVQMGKNYGLAAWKEDQTKGIWRAVLAGLGNTQGTAEAVP